jgi:hypothetical protein
MNATSKVEVYGFDLGHYERGYKKNDNVYCADFGGAVAKENAFGVFLKQLAENVQDLIASALCWLVMFALHLEKGLCTAIGVREKSDAHDIPKPLLAMVRFFLRNACYSIILTGLTVNFLLSGMLMAFAISTLTTAVVIFRFTKLAPQLSKRRKIWRFFYQSYWMFEEDKNFRRRLDDDSILVRPIFVHEDGFHYTRTAPPYVRPNSIAAKLFVKFMRGDHDCII